MKLINCNHIKKGVPLSWPAPGAAGTAAAGWHCWRQRGRPARPHSEEGEAAASTAATVFAKASGCSKAVVTGRKRSRVSPARGSQFKLAGFGQLLSLSLMCLVVVSDFQQQIANQCAQSTKKQLEGEESLLAAFSSRGGHGNDTSLAARSDKTTTATAATTVAARCARPLLMQAEAIADANRLYEDLMMTYNRIVRPVANNTDRVVVKLGLKLSQLIDVNLKNQIMTTNVWLKQEWSDYKLKWKPDEYGGIKDINLPAEQIWLPDIVLYNSAEGFFGVSIMTKAKVSYDGNVTWNPPAIFRSSCKIDITYFPFDSQTCELKFGSWTFGTQIDLRHGGDERVNVTIESGSDLSEYYQNVEWDIMKAIARTMEHRYACCPDDIYTDVTFNITLRRKPLFYTVNLILPCLGITILSFLVFYLPSDSGEKVTLTISILVSLIFFLSVLIETIPSTSLVMPLLGKYLVFTMVLITFSVCATVCVLNIHFRTPSTHLMAPWVKRWCIDILPKYLFMNVPQYQNQQAQILPEQLIYLHNQAYQLGGWPLPLAPPLQAIVTDPKNIIQAAHPQQHQPQAAAAAQQANLQANNAPAGLQSGGQQQLQHMSSSSSSFRQLDPGKLDANDLLATPNNNKLSISPSSLFLPYLQSEAARRLQMQRSRSSERDNRSTSENPAQNTTTTSTSLSTSVLPNTIINANTNNSNNKNCDNSQRVGGGSTVPAGNKPRKPIGTSSSGGASGGSTSLEMRAAAGEEPAQIRKEAAKSGAAKRQREAPKSSGGRFWGLFGNKLTEKPENESGADADHDEAAAEQSDNSPLNLVSLPHFRFASGGQQHQLKHDTSSSFENDYQHHNHFQARASICSTNLWRIGPTRRCSMTVANNYPTYYRPLAQLAHLPHSHAHSASGGAHQLSTMSGCVQSHRYHTHLASLTSSSNEESSPMSDGGRKLSAVGALITAAASNLAVRPRQQQQVAGSSSQSMRAAATGYAKASMQSSNWLPSSAGTNNQQHRSDRIVGPMMSMTLSPTPPPPLPPEPPFGQLSKQLGAAGSKFQMISPALHTVAMQRQCQQAFTSLQKQLGSPAAGGFSGGYSHETSQRSNMMMMAADNQRFPQQYQADPSLSNFSQQPQPMTRSRSTDHRLHSASIADYPTAQMGASQALYQPQQRPTAMRGADGGGFAPPPPPPTLQAAAGINSMYRQQQASQNGSGFGPPLAGSSNGLANIGAATAVTGPSTYHQQLMQQPQLIGRALGQAYMQRLQRQPTIYSLHSNNVVLRPSRPAQRGPTTSTHTYLMSLGGADQHRLQAASPSGGFLADRMRRSRSQTSLDRRAKLFGSGDGDQCEQCASQTNNYLRRADSSVRVSRSDCSGELERSRFAGSNNSGCNCDSQRRRRLHSASGGGCEMETQMIHGSTSHSSNKSAGYQLQQQQQQLRQRQNINREPCYACCGQHQDMMGADLRANGPTTVVGLAGCPGCRGALASSGGAGDAGADQFQAPPLSSLGLMRLISEVEKAIQNAMFIAQHIDNLDEFESVKENWKYIAMVIDRIFLIIFLIAGIVGTAAIVAMIPWDYYIIEKPIDLQLTRMLALNLTQGLSYPAQCQNITR